MYIITVTIPQTRISRLFKQNHVRWTGPLGLLLITGPISPSDVQVQQVVFLRTQSHSLLIGAMDEEEKRDIKVEDEMGREAAGYNFGQG